MLVAVSLLVAVSANQDNDEATESRPISISEDVYSEEEEASLVEAVNNEPSSLPSNNGHSGGQNGPEVEETLTLVPVDEEGAPKKPTLRYLSAPLSDGRVSLCPLDVKYCVMNVQCWPKAASKGMLPLGICCKLQSLVGEHVLVLFKHTAHCAF